MKKTTKLFTLLMLLVFFQFTSCQKEEVVLIEENPEQGTLTDNSPLTLLMIRTSLNDGNNDDFIDGANCFSIAFPFMVMVGDTEFNIENELDYQDVLDFIEASGGTVNDIEIVFPITIVFPNYDEIIVNNPEELNNYIAACEDEIIDDIDCIDFIYPISFFVYNSETEITTTVTVNDDAELFIFLSTLSNTDFISIDFPISVELGDGSVVEVNSNQELEDLINSCENSGNTDVSDLEEYLTTDTWFVDFFFDETDETSNFCEYGFNFETGGAVSASNGSNSVDGTWNVILDSDELKVVLDFGNEIPFDKLNDDWKVINGTINEIEMQDVSGGNGGVNLLTFNRETTNCEGGNNSELEGYLTTDSWFIAYYFDAVDETSDFCEYELTFNIDGSVTALNGTDAVNGSWSVITNNGIEKVVFDFGTTIPFDKINDDWDVLNASMLEIEMQDVSGGNGGTDLLTLDREPTVCSGNTSEIEDYLTTDSWYVAYYFDDVDETSNYCEFEFIFNIDGTVVANNGTDNVNGTWSVGVDNGVDKIILDFGVTVPFDVLNDDWDVLNASNLVIEMQDVSGGNGGTDYLTIDRTPTICEDENTYLEEVLLDGQWLVALYLNDGINETNNYNNYILEFFNDGTVTASYGGNVLNGTWDVTGNTQDLNLVLDFGIQIPFDEFNGDWDVLDVQVDRVELEDVSGGGGGTDTLVFEKI
ncbi:MAG: hypothetical protein QM499_12680 [Flavobacteriaceae bacterium]